VRSGKRVIFNMKWDPGGGEIRKEGDIQHEVGSRRR
jgi:hypothetical protein